MQAHTALMALAALGTLAAVAAERGGGIKIGGGALGAGGREGARGTGVRVGGEGNIRRPRTSPAPPPPRAPSTITAALVVPHKSFGARDYTKAEKAALSKLPRKYRLHLRFNVTLSMQGLTPSPMCKCTTLSDSEYVHILFLYSIAAFECP